jgi:hypothetical protein
MPDQVVQANIIVLPQITVTNPRVKHGDVYVPPVDTDENGNPMKEGVGYGPTTGGSGGGGGGGEAGGGFGGGSGGGGGFSFDWGSFLFNLGTGGGGRHGSIIIGDLEGEFAEQE